MSPITKEFTKEQLQQIIETDHVQCGEASALARIALASLEAEPVAWLLSGGGAKNHVSFDSGNAYADPLREVTPLYTATPAPVSVPEPIKRNDADGWWMYKGRRVGGGCAEWYNRALDDCRAAMLQGAEPVTTAYKLPANTPCKDAPEHIWLQTAGVWPENGEFSELTWCSDNQHKDDTLYVRADVVSGNSPAIPDGFEDRNNKIAYDILGFGRLVVSGNSSGDLDLEIREFSFDRGSAPTPLKNLKPKYAVQAIVNRLQSYCDAMSCDDLEDIRDIPSQQQREGE